MSDPVLDVRDYAFTEEDRLLLDANVWLSIYGPDPTARRRSTAYQRAFRRMRTARSQLFTDVLVLSEFINRFARQLYVQQWPRGHPAGFKGFRDSPGFRPVAEEIALNATKICSAAARCDTPLASIDIGSLLCQFGTAKHDFNDLVLSTLCRTQRLTFVTDDADFRGSGHRVLTANPRLLP